MITSTGSPVQHESLLKTLLDVILLPKQLALCNCAAHQKDKSEIIKGNNFADQAAKLAAQQTVDTLMSASAMQIPLDVLKDHQPQNRRNG